MAYLSKSRGVICYITHTLIFRKEWRWGCLLRKFLKATLIVAAEGVSFAVVPAAPGTMICVSVHVPEGMWNWKSVVMRSLTTTLMLY